MSGYDNSRLRDFRSGESASSGQRRSRSPEGSGRGGFQGRRDYSGGDRGGRGGYGGDRGGRGGYGGDRGGRGGRGSYSSDRGGRGGRGGGDRGDRRGYQYIPSNLPPLPSTVPVPQGGRLFEQPVFPLRGQVGNLTKVLVNHYEIQSLPLIKIHTYDVSLKVPASSQHRGSDEVAPNQLAKVLVHDALISLLGRRFVFDGVSLGWSPDMIVPEGQNSASTIISLPGSRPDRLNEVEVTVKSTGSLNIAALAHAILKNNIPQNPMGDKLLEDNLKWLGNLFRMDPASRFVTRPNANAYFGRSPGTSVPLQSTGQVLEAWRGMFQTVQIRFGRLTINVDTATTAFWVPNVRLVDSCRTLTGVLLSNLEDLYRHEAHRFLAGCDRLIGMFFCVRHLTRDRNARKVKFRGFTLKNAEETTFTLTKDGVDGQETSVQQYYLTKYKIQLQYPKLPLVDSKDGCFPLELCYSAEGERYKEVLQGAETADFIKFATCPATVRAQQITENVQKLHWHDLALPKEFGVSVKPHMLEVDARILRNPKIAYGNNQAEEPRFGSWNLRYKRLLQPVSINSWALLYFSGEDRKDQRTLDQLTFAIAQAFGNLGISMPKSEPPIIIGNPHGNVPALVGETLTAADQKFHTKPDLLMVLRHGSDEALYRAIKQVCELQFGVASQVMMAEKVMRDRGQDQYLANVGLKVNVKLGGVNSKLTEELFGGDKGWMMIGADTAHQGPAQMRQNPPPPAYGAVVGTYDPSCIRYTGIGVAQLAKEQIIASFNALSKELLKRYKERNDGRMPTSILFWRDGLSEGQFSKILSEEVEPLRSACRELSPTRRINITTVVCVKRHHTRLFPTEGGDKLGNVLPGTVVENDGSRNDIYLVSHAGLQGTVRPTRYVTIEDENKLSATDFQRITNNICSTYARATRAVSVVPPVYYADQVCERARLHLRTGPNGDSFSGEVHQKHRFNMYWQ